MSPLFLLTLFLTSVFSYDYYKFAVELPGAVCQVQDCDQADLGSLTSTSLNMHGFWPNSNSGDVENCLENDYDESKFQSDILNEMNQEWVGLYSSSNTFRSHEWGKHGTCWAKAHQQNFVMASGSSDFLPNNKKMGFDYYASMNAYFKQGLSLKDNAGLDEALFSNGGNYQASLKKIKSIIANTLNVSHFDVYCKKSDGKELLTEIRWCIDLDYNVMECPGAITQCSSSEDITVAQLSN